MWLEPFSSPPNIYSALSILYVHPDCASMTLGYSFSRGQDCSSGNNTSPCGIESGQHNSFCSIDILPGKLERNRIFQLQLFFTGWPDQVLKVSGLSNIRKKWALNRQWLNVSREIRYQASKWTHSNQFRKILHRLNTRDMQK